MHKKFTYLMLLYTLSVFSQKAPDFILKNLSGDDVSLSDFSGNLVVLYWHASWSMECREAFPALRSYFNKITRRYAHKNMRVISISLDNKDPEILKSTVQRQGIIYLTLLDPLATTGNMYDLKKLPLITIIGKDGYTIKQMRGYSPRTTIEQLQHILEEFIQ